jgi:aquaporin Z
MEAAALGIFMVSACFFGVLLEYPGSPVRQAIEDPPVRRLLGGLAMGLTAITLIYSPWGQQSGAHMNPSVTLTFLRLGRVHPRDAAFYVAAQFVGGAAGVALAATLLPRFVPHPSVHYAVTAPGEGGAAVAFLAELSSPSC